MHEKLIMELYEQGEENWKNASNNGDNSDFAKANLLFSGLTVLSKDVAEYLAATGRVAGESAVFLELYGSSMEDERRMWEINGSELFLPLDQAGLPKGFAQAAAQGKVDLSPLGDSRIHHEWTEKPGMIIFEKFRAKFKETICGKDGPYEKFQNKLLGQADLPVAIVSSILAVGFSMATFWVPLVVYFVLLLIKTGLKTYCE